MRKEADELAAAQPVARTVDGDARQPRLQLGAALKLAEVRVGLNECVLRDRVGLGVVAEMA